MYHQFRIDEFPIVTLGEAKVCDFIAVDAIEPLHLVQESLNKVDPAILDLIVPQVGILSVDIDTLHTQLAQKSIDVLGTRSDPLNQLVPRCSEPWADKISIPVH